MAKRGLIAFTKLYLEAETKKIILCFDKLHKQIGKQGELSRKQEEEEKEEKLMLEERIEIITLSSWKRKCKQELIGE